MIVFGEFRLFFEVPVQVVKTDAKDQTRETEIQEGQGRPAPFSSVWFYRNTRMLTWCEGDVKKFLI